MTQAGYEPRGPANVDADEDIAVGSLAASAVGKLADRRPGAGPSGVDEEGTPETKFGLRPPSTTTNSPKVDAGKKVSAPDADKPSSPFGVALKPTNSPAAKESVPVKSDGSTPRGTEPGRLQVGCGRDRL